MLAAAALAAACASAPRPRATGLFTSLPIFWRETGSLGDLLKNDGPPHWALALLQGQGPVRPLDTLLPGPEGSPLNAAGRLVMAQPRPLAPAENVALDAWVRGGGRLLLFADPMLTAHSVFAIGDRRRPEDVAMLSPILARWGLKLEFDEDQPAGERGAKLFGATIPVNLPGRLSPLGKSRDCRFEPGGIAALCRIGKGRVLAVADAALLESGAENGGNVRIAGLERLLAELGQAR